MRITVAIICLLLGMGLVGTSRGQTAPTPDAEPRNGQSAGEIEAAACRIPLEITDEAERRPGGALYTGMAMATQSQHGHSMPDMEGAHTTHKPQHGGAFFMAPDKIHHLEGIYSDDCGFRLVFYNAFTEPIHADRFRAFIWIIPDSEEEPDMIRFLSPAPDGSVLEATTGGPPGRPFGIEIYVKFPESEEPELFNIRVSD